MKQIQIVFSLFCLLSFLTIDVICQDSDDLYANPGEKLPKKKSKSTSENVAEPICDIKTDKVDEFTKNRIIEIQTKYIGKAEYGRQLIAGISFIKDQLLLRIELYTYSSYSSSETDS